MIKYIPGKINDSAGRVEAPGTEIDGVRARKANYVPSLLDSSRLDFDSIPDLIEPPPVRAPPPCALRRRRMSATNRGENPKVSTTS